MLPAASPASAAVTSPSPATNQNGSRAHLPQAPETARSSAGEATAANVKTETAKAVTAPEQSAIAPRLRDQETTERSERAPLAKDAPTGPPPTFVESPLERQARVVFDPPDLNAMPQKSEAVPQIEAEPRGEETGPSPEPPVGAPEANAEAPPQDPPPTPTERAEASFQETITLSEPKEPASIDVAR